MKRGIAVAGNMVVDILYPIQGLPGAGELTTIQEGISRSTGGAVCNVLMDLTKLDPQLKLQAFGRVGADPEGDFLLNTLKECRRIDVSQIRREGVTSFTAVMADAVTSQRTFFHYRGANAQFDVTDIDWDRVDADLLHIGYVLLLDTLDTADADYGTRMARLLHDAQAHGIKTSIDVASERGTRFEKLVPPALRFTDYCIINELEAQQITGIKLRGDDGALVPRNMPEALRRLMSLGVSTWAVIHCPEGGYGMEQGDRMAAVESLKLPAGYIKGTVGAGDAFCAGVLLGAHRGLPLKQAIELGVASAACSLSESGATEGMRTAEFALKLYRDYRDEKISLEAPMRKYLAGIDVGTSSVKCIVIGDDGAVLSSCSEKYPLYTPQVGWSEQDPEEWWEATKKAIRKAVEKSGVKPEEIVGLGFSGQMHGLVALDKDDKVLRHAILWNDQRTSEECDDIIRDAGGLVRLIGYTNNTMLTGFTGGKILWVKKHEPEIFKRMASFMMPKDYIRFRITGEKATDASDASGTGLFDVKNRRWSNELIRRLGFDEAIFPKVYESDEAAGVVTPQAAAETGLKAGMTVYAGGGDAVIQTTGMGIVKEGTIGLIIGTSGIVSMSLDSFAENEGGKLQFFCNNDRNKWQAFGCQLSSGGSLDWFAQTVYGGEFKTLDKQAGESPAGSRNLVFLPYLTGERCPHADPYARGVFFGLSSQHGRGDMARAVMEGVTFGLKEIYEIILKGNPNLEPVEVISSGGGSKSAIWRQIQADVFNLPVKTLTGAAEGGAYGGAVVAGVGAGVWANIEDAAKCLKVETVTEPIPENVYKLQRLYGVYQGLYQDLKMRFKSLMD